MKDKLKELFNAGDKTVVITGAGGFFGRYIAKTFLEIGARVVLLSRSERVLRQSQQYRREYGTNKVVSVRVDFYNRKKAEKILKEIAGKYDVDVLVNNAYDLSPRTGFNTLKGHLENSTYAQWKCAFESGVYWAVLTTQVFGGQFRKRERGSIINIGSMYGIVAPNPKLYEGRKFLNPPTYGVNKAGIIALTRYTASFWGRYGVRCNAVLPGAFSNVETESPNSVSPDDPFLEKLKGNTALHRIGHPDDLRGILVYLASDASSYMTGQSIVIDGGWTIV